MNEAKNFVVDKNNETKNFAMITEDKVTEIFCIAAHPTNPVEGCADANPKLLLNDT